MDKEKATERISFRISPYMKEKIERRAAEEGRTPSNLINNIIADYLKRIEDAKKVLNSERL